MPQLDIVCATWNTENQSPKDEHIAKFCDALWKDRKQKAPDFVVIGLQETVPYENDVKQGWVAQRCLKKAANEMHAIIASKEPVVGPKIKGKTKLTEPWCYQHIGIMQRSDSPWRIRDIHGFKKRKGPGSEKGAVALVVDIEPTSSTSSSSSTTSSSSSSSSSSTTTSSSSGCIRLVFVSTHLSPEGQEDELTEYFSWLNDLAKKGLIERPAGPAIPAGEVSNICFVMGDLNFRLFPNLKVPQEAAGLPSRDDNSDKWAEALLSPLKRDLLFKHYDALENAANRKYPNLLPKEWSFPRPNTNDGAHICFPTYKRQKGKQAEGYVNIIKAGPGDKAAREALKHLYNLTDKHFWDDGRNAWNIGWLDRIGYVIRNHSNSMNITNSVVSCWDFFEMVQSDHTPVFLQLKVDVT